MSTEYIPIPAKDIAELRHTLVGYHRTITPQLWASMLATGEGGWFWIPTEWAHLPIPQIADRLAQAEADRVQAGQLFSVTAEATAEAIAAGRELPRFNLHRSHLPAEHGFLVWDAPIDTARGVEEPITACSWGPHGDKQVWVSFYVDGSQLYQTMPEAKRDLLHRFGYEREIVLPFGLDRWFSELPGLEAVARDYEQPVRTLLATWLHMGQQRLTQISERPADRKSRVARTLAKRGRPLPPVRVVTLRPWEGTQGAGRGGGRKLSTRVDVAGYWRRRPHTTGQEPDDMVWVRPHERGPLDAPVSRVQQVKRVVV